MEYPNGNVEEVLYELKDVACAVAITRETPAQKITYGIHLVRELERNHGPEQCLEDYNITWSPVFEYLFLCLSLFLLYALLTPSHRLQHTVKYFRLFSCHSYNNSTKQILLFFVCI